MDFRKLMPWPNEGWTRDSDWRSKPIDPRIYHQPITVSILFCRRQKTAGSKEKFAFRFGRSAHPFFRLTLKTPSPVGRTLFSTFLNVPFLGTKGRSEMWYFIPLSEMSPRSSGRWIFARKFTRLRKTIIFVDSDSNAPLSSRPSWAVVSGSAREEPASLTVRSSSLLELRAQDRHTLPHTLQLDRQLSCLPSLLSRAWSAELRLLRKRMRCVLKICPSWNWLLAHFFLACLLKVFAKEPSFLAELRCPMSYLERAVSNFQ